MRWLHTIHISITIVLALAFIDCITSGYTYFVPDLITKPVVITHPEPGKPLLISWQYKAGTECKRTLTAWLKPESAKAYNIPIDDFKKPDGATNQKRMNTWAHLPKNIKPGAYRISIVINYNCSINLKRRQTLTPVLIEVD